MSFGGGSNSSQQQQASASNALGYNWASNLGQSTQGSATEGLNVGGSYVAGQQLPFLEMLYKQAADTYKSIPNLQNVAQGIVNPLMKGATSAFDTLGDLSDPTALIEAQSGSLKSGLQDLFSQGLMGVGAEATGAGAFGGSRHALQEAALGGEVSKAYTQGYGDIVANARNQAAQAAQAQIGAAPGIANLGLSPYMANFQPLQAFASLLGAPTILQSNFGQTSGSSYGQSTNAGQSGGVNSGSSQSYGSGSGEGYNFNMGFGSGKGGGG